MTLTKRLIEAAALCAVGAAVLARHDATLAAEGRGAAPAAVTRSVALPPVACTRLSMSFHAVSAAVRVASKSKPGASAARLP